MSTGHGSCVGLGGGSGFGGRDGWVWVTEIGMRVEREVGVTSETLKGGGEAGGTVSKRYIWASACPRPRACPVPMADTLRPERAYG